MNLIETVKNLFVFSIYFLKAQGNQNPIYQTASTTK